MNKEKSYNWEKEFDKEFRTGEKAWHPNYVLVKSFISSLLEKERERGYLKGLKVGQKAFDQHNELNNLKV